MRNYPHKPDGGFWERDLASISRMLVRADALTPELLATKNDRFLYLNSGRALSCAREAYGLEKGDTLVLEFLRESNRSFRKQLEQRLPINDLNQYVNQLCVAIILGDAELTSRLSGLRRADYANANVAYPECVSQMAECLALTVSGPFDAAQASLNTAFQSLTDESLSREERETVEEVLQALQAILSEDSPALSEVLSRRCQAAPGRLRDPRRRNLSEGAFDLLALGLAGLARERGMAVSVHSVYLPLELLKEG